MNAKLASACPFSPSGHHRVYYSARQHGIRSTVGRGSCCRDCSGEVYYVGGRWQSAPPGDFLVGMMLQFQERMIEGDPDRRGEPIGFLTAAGGSSAPRYSFTILPPMPEVMS